MCHDGHLAVTLLLLGTCASQSATQRWRRSEMRSAHQTDKHDALKSRLAGVLVSAIDVSHNVIQIGIQDIHIHELAPARRLFE